MFTDAPVERAGAGATALQLLASVFGLLTVIVPSFLSRMLVGPVKRQPVPRRAGSVRALSPELEGGGNIGGPRAGSLHERNDGFLPPPASCHRLGLRTAGGQGFAPSPSHELDVVTGPWN